MRRRWGPYETSKAYVVAEHFPILINVMSQHLIKDDIITLSSLLHVLFPCDEDQTLIVDEFSEEVLQEQCPPDLSFVEEKDVRIAAACVHAYHLPVMVIPPD